MKIDLSRLVTAEDKATANQARRAGIVRAECTRRITRVLDMQTMLNIQGAAIAQVLDRKELVTFRAGRAWMREMQLTCRAMIADETVDPADDDNWPTLPDGVSALAALY